MILMETVNDIIKINTNSMVIKETDKKEMMCSVNNNMALGTTGPPNGH